MILSRLTLSSISETFSCSDQCTYSQQIAGTHNWILHAWAPGYTKTTGTHAPVVAAQYYLIFKKLEISMYAFQLEVILLLIISNALNLSVNTVKEISGRLLY